MDISQADWLNYKDKLAAISQKAADEFTDWIISKGGYRYGNVTKDEMIAYAYALSTKYGEATASLAAEMYDETAALSGVSVPSAEVADTASYGEIAKAINGVTKTITTDSNLGNVVARYVKRAGADTTLKNVERDGAQFAWIPAGDTCPFCLTLASNGWQYQSKNAMKNGHASHIHANCDCTYAVRFDNKTNVKGYNPEKYREMYYNAEGKTPQERINSMRRIHYQENRDKILAQKKANYEEKKKYLSKEDSHKGQPNKNTRIARKTIESPDYGRRLSRLQESKKVINVAKTEARKMLDHRNGTLFEDLTYIDSVTGEFITRNDYNKEREVWPNKKMKTMLENADNRTIIAIHNHPESTFPSLADIRSAKKYKYGIIACHDGTLIKYTSNDKINGPAYVSAVANLEKTGYNKKGIDNFISEAKKAGIIIEVLV